MQQEDILLFVREVPDDIPVFLLFLLSGTGKDVGGLRSQTSAAAVIVLLIRADTVEYKILSLSFVQKKAVGEWIVDVL